MQFLSVSAGNIWLQALETASTETLFLKVESISAFSRTYITLISNSSTSCVQNLQALRRMNNDLLLSAGCVPGSSSRVFTFSSTTLCTEEAASLTAWVNAVAMLPPSTRLTPRDVSGIRCQTPFSNSILPAYDNIAFSFFSVGHRSHNPRSLTASPPRTTIRTLAPRRCLAQPCTYTRVHAPALCAGLWALARVPAAMFRLPSPTCSTRPSSIRVHGLLTCSPCHHLASFSFLAVRLKWRVIARHYLFTEFLQSRRARR